MHADQAALPGRCHASSARRPTIHRRLPIRIAALDSAPPQRLSPPRSKAATKRCARRRSASSWTARVCGRSRGSLPERRAACPARPRARRAGASRTAVDAGSLEFETLRAPPVNVSALLAVAGYSSDPERLPRTLASIDEAERRALVLDGPSSRIRQLAAQSVSDPAELRHLLKQLHGKDKNVYKIIREKCDALNAEEHDDREGAQRCHPCLRVARAACAPDLRGRLRADVAALSHALASARGVRGTRLCASARRGRSSAARKSSPSTTSASRRKPRRRRRGWRARPNARRPCVSPSSKPRARREAAERDGGRDGGAARGRRGARAAAAAAEAATLRELNALIGKAHAALREGATGRASGLRRALEEKLGALAAVPLPVSRQVQKLDSIARRAQGLEGACGGAQARRAHPGDGVAHRRVTGAAGARGAHPSAAGRLEDGEQGRPQRLGCGLAAVSSGG